MTKSILIVAIFGILLAVCTASPWNRIVGGGLAAPNQFPHQVSLRVDGSHICGGSVISEKWILTAAHCVTFPVKAFTIVAGTNSVRSGGEKRTVSRIISHERYGNFQNDIALMELSEPLKYTDSIKPIVIAKNEVPDYAQIIISGWGRIYTGGPISEELKYNKLVTKMTPAQCKRSVGYVFYNGLVCFAHTSGNGACNGDSGGPAVYNNELIGVANFVLGGCGTGNPDGYAKPSYFIKWIEQNTGLRL